MIPTGFTSLGWQLPLTVSLISLIVCIVVLALCLAAWHKWSSEAAVPVGATAGCFGIIALVPFLLFAVPFNPAYWDDYRVEGRVTSVSNTWTEDGGDLARTPVVTLDTVDRPLVIDDPRAITLDGHDVTLTCTIDWHYRAADAYTCRIAAIGRAS